MKPQTLQIKLQEMYTINALYMTTNHIHKSIKEQKKSYRIHSCIQETSIIIQISYEFQIMVLYFFLLGNNFKNRIFFSRVWTWSTSSKSNRKPKSLTYLILIPNWQKIDLGKFYNYPCLSFCQSVHIKKMICFLKKKLIIITITKSKINTKSTKLHLAEFIIIVVFHVTIVCKFAVIHYM